MNCSTEGRFLRPWLGSAALVTAVRSLHAAPVGYDLGLQFQAAQNFLAGNGLALYRHLGPDLTESATLITLTSFAAGYSLCAAALLGLGLDVGTVVKVLGAVGTILGWWGWGKLAYPFFRQGLQQGPIWKWAALTVTISSPLLFTPEWGGTDIFLWAAVPWVLHWVIKASEGRVPGNWWFNTAAGALCGLSILMRYASLFLTVYAAFLIWWQAQTRLPVLMRRWAFFGLGLLPALGLQLYINHVLSNTPATPGSLVLSNPGIAVILQRIWDGVPLLSTANFPWVFWISWKGFDQLFSEPASPWPWQLGITLAIFVFLVLAARSYQVGLDTAAQDRRVAAVGLFVALPLVLWGCMMLGSHDFLGDRRYYWPLVPLSVFVAYSVASLPDLAIKISLSRILQRMGIIYLTGYIAVSLACMAFLFLPGSHGSNQRAKLLGSAPHPWPSMAVTYELSPARRLVMGLLKEQPDTLLLTSKAGWFYWDPTVDQSRLHELHCGGWKATHVTGPARIIILTFDQGGPQELWHYVAFPGNRSGQARARCAEWLPDLSLLQRFPEEGVKVLESRVPAGGHLRAGS